jgi:indole-3-glycerol phosphate synthase
VSLETSVQLAQAGADRAVLISESGIQSADDIQRLHGVGYQGFLIGESLMRENDPGAALKKFTQRREGERESTPGQ